MISCVQLSNCRRKDRRNGDSQRLRLMEKIFYGDGEETMDFVSQTIVEAALLVAKNSGATGQKFIICYTRPITVNQLC
jgi:nucleoside-diphosphate-sugar epimerase